MEKLWFDQYQEGVPHDINPDAYSSLTQLFDETLHKHSKYTAFSNMGTSITYGELNKLSRDFAAYLQQLGLKKGARIAIMLPNILQYPIALFAILRAGFVVVNTNPLYTANEFIPLIENTGAEVVIVLANFAHIVEEALPRTTSIKHVIITEIGDLFPPVKRCIYNWAAKYIKKAVPKYSLNCIAFNVAMQLGTKQPLLDVSCYHDDIAFIQPTGGTTGSLKGAMLSHKNIIANMLQATAWITPAGASHLDIIVTAIPMYHIFSLMINCLTFFRLGATNILITNPRDTKAFIKEIKHAKFTVITGVNTLFSNLLKHPKSKHIDFSKLKFALSGGMALQKNVAIRWRELTKAPILEAYGLTEASPCVSCYPLSLKTYNGSIGLPLPSTNISIRDLTGEELPLGDIGELCISGPQVMLGYWKNPEETARAFWPDGFLRTGDSAKVDALGYIYLVDRIKDLIIVSGFNVYPTEIEHVIEQLPGVTEVAVIGVNRENGGEEVKACIVKSNPALTADEIIEHCRLYLTAYKIPKIIEFYPELPKSNVGKILKRVLKSQDNNT